MFQSQRCPCLCSKFRTCLLEILAFSCFLLTLPLKTFQSQKIIAPRHEQHTEPQASISTVVHTTILAQSRHPCQNFIAEFMEAPFESVDLQQRSIQHHLQSLFWHGVSVSSTDTGQARRFLPPPGFLASVNSTNARIASQRILGLAKRICLSFTVCSPASPLLRLGTESGNPESQLLFQFLCSILAVMAVGFSSLLGEQKLVGPIPLDTAPVLIIENPLDSYYKLSNSELKLGSKTIPGIKFCPGRLKHVKSIDAIFTDENQVSPVLFFCRHSSINLLLLSM